MSERKYYWLKLKEDFFNREDIHIIRSMDNGEKLLIFLLELMLRSVKYDGFLIRPDGKAYDKNSLSLITDTDKDIIDIGLKAFLEMGILTKEDNVIYMAIIEELVGFEGSSAKRVREFRKRQKALQSNEASQSNVALQDALHVTLHGNGEKEIEKERKIEKELYSLWQKQNNLLTHTVSSPHILALSDTLKSYTPLEIGRAIIRYNKVIILKDSLYPFKWTLKDFLVKGLHRFVEQNLTEKDFVSKFTEESDTKADSYLDKRKEEYGNNNKEKSQEC